VPTAHLAREAIRFHPRLPEKLEAAAGLPLGLADKVLLAIDRPEEIPGKAASSAAPTGRRPAPIICGPSGGP
jgi:monoamine oxidase